MKRRSFIVMSGSMAAGGLALGLPAFMSAEASAASPAAGMGFGATAEGAEVGVWVVIKPDDTCVIRVARSEMGQGVYTSMPMLIAEELNVDINQIKVDIAPPGAVYVNALLGAQITGGSTSVRDGWEKLRILEIMKDSRVGSYGVIALGLALLGKFTLLAGLDPALVPGALLAGHALSRFCATVLLATMDYVRDDLLAKAVPNKITEPQMTCHRLSRSSNNTAPSKLANKGMR